MRWAAVIGSPIEHSLSPVLHEAAWASLGEEYRQWRYERLEVDRGDLPGVLERLRSDALAVGLSVTMPLKQDLLALVDAVDPMAQAVGAANTVVPAGGVLAAFNTDVHGITEALGEAWSGAGVEAGCARTVILGNGATAASALAAVGSLGAREITLVARRFHGPGSALLAAQRLGVSVGTCPWQDADRAAEVISEADLVISTLPRGVADGIAPRLAVGPSQSLLDVVYAPRRTALVDAWERGGGVVARGEVMLLHQAVQQVRLMTGRDADVEAMRAALLAALEGRGE